VGGGGLENLPPELSNERLLTAVCSRVAHCPAFFKQSTAFSHIPFVRCTFTIHFNNLPVNFSRMNIFSVKTLITDRMSHGIFDFRVHL